MDKKLKAPKEVVLCPQCQCWEPHHFKTCSEVSGKYCRECGARKPRHYPACSQDTIKFSRWWVPEYQQGIMDAYLTMVEAAKHEGTYKDPPQIPLEVKYGSEQNVNPIIGQRIMKAIFMMLESGSQAEMLGMKRAIYEEIDKRK